MRTTLVLGKSCLRIASEAKQSSPLKALDCFVAALPAMTEGSAAFASGRHPRWLGSRHALTRPEIDLGSSCGWGRVMHAWGRCVVLLLPLVALQLGGCAVVDQYSGRAVGFNLEAEQATQQALLLNIVRASHRRPMQFTSVQSITGIASANLTGGLSTRRA